MKKLILAMLAWFSTMVLITAVASAHVIVTPNQVGTAKFQTFNISVPNERDSAVIGLRLTIPDGLKEASPTVKAGWQIDLKKSGSGEDASVNEIDWTAGTIPVGQRDDFSFSAQVPSDATTLQWKAYQMYADGTTVSWDKAPSGSDDDSGTSGPYSETKIVNDIPDTTNNSPNQSTTTAEYVSGIALLIAVTALVIAARKRA